MPRGGDDGRRPGRRTPTADSGGGLGRPTRAADSGADPRRRPGRACTADMDEDGTPSGGIRPRLRSSSHDRRTRRYPPFRPHRRVAPGRHDLALAPCARPVYPRIDSTRIDSTHDADPGPQTTPTTRQ
ncbi:hypothetical protein GCM10017608_02630 [Agromyces luteolus]|nr:hypothetical protein GCM10017608_02630 [Agromyces luteolus]